MNWSFLFVDVGAVAPTSPLKCDLLGIGTAVGSLVGGLFNYQSQKKTNEMQEMLSREQMAQQVEENQKNRDFQERMWHEQNEYNTPSAMMERYKEAGLNPYLVGGDSGIGSAGSVGSPSMAGQGSVPNLQAPKMDLSTPMQLALQGEQTSAVVANQETVALNNILDAARKAYDINGVDGAQQVLDMYLPLIGDVKNSPVVQQFKVEQAFRELNNELFDFKLQIQERFGYQTAERTLEYLTNQTWKIWNEIDKVSSETFLNYQKADELLSQIARNFAEANNLNADTQTINDCRKAIVDTLSFQRDVAYMEKEEESAEFSSREGIRLYKRQPEAKMKRAQAEFELNPTWNKRVKAVQTFKDIVGYNGFGFGINYNNSNINGNYNSNNVIDRVKHTRKSQSWSNPRDDGSRVNNSVTWYE